MTGLAQFTLLELIPASDLRLTLILHQHIETDSIHHLCWTLERSDTPELGLIHKFFTIKYAN